MGEKAKESCVELISDAFKERHEGETRRGSLCLKTLSHSLTQSHIVSCPWDYRSRPLCRASIIKTRRTVCSCWLLPLALLTISRRSDLVEGTPATVLGSHITFAVLSADDPEHSGFFRGMGLLRSVAKKVLGNVGSDKHSISRLSRESNDMLKASCTRGWGFLKYRSFLIKYIHILYITPTTTTTL